MRIAILSKDNQVLGFLDNDAPSALHFYDDTLHIYLTGTAHTFEFTCSENHEDAQLLEVGNKLAFLYKNKPYYLNIMTTSHTETEITVEAWAYCLELLNETAKAYSATEAMSFEAYFKKMIYSNDVISIGLNEVNDKKIKNEWTSTTDTLLKRLYSLADTFDAELEFVPVLNDDYTFSKIEVNVYKEHSDTNQGIGEKRTDANYRYGKGVDGITKKQDITSLYTAIRPTGEDDLTISGVEDRTVTDDDGNVLYFHKKGSGLIYAKQAMETFPSAVGTDDKYICYNWETDYSTTEALYGNALAKLKTISVPDSSYEIEGAIDVNIGDTITVIDESFNPALYLETRVTEQEISFTDSTKNKSTFENTKELESQIDDSLTKRVEELAKATASAADKAESAATKVETVTADVEAVKTTATAAKEAAETATETANTATATATQASEAANNAVVSSVTEYYLSTSATSQTGGSWSTTSPTWTEGTYVWTRTKTTTKSGTVSYSNAACVTGNTGAQGEQGIQGETGAKGDKGDKGAKGDKGDKGDTGATGATGAGFQWNMLAKTNTSDLVFGGVTDNGEYDASEIVEDGIVIKRLKGTDKTEQATSWNFCYLYDKGKESLKEICSKAEDNPTITISMDARLNFDYSGNLKIGILTADGKYTAYTLTTTSVEFEANVWGHTAATCKVASTPSYKENTIVYISTISSSLKTAGNTMDIKNVKIEPGTTSTSWCTTQAETIGKDGSDGTSVSKTYTQYYLSTSNTTQTGGSWADTMPTWSSGKYIWQREITVLSTGSTVTGTAVLSNGLNSANQTASTANSNASSAVSTANTANTNASTAVSTANTAKKTADTAQTTADTAKKTADTAQTTANTAKTATDQLNTLIRETTEGVEVCKKDSSGAIKGMKTVQTADAYLIEDANGTELASYGANKVYIGKNSQSAVIDLCNGQTQISTAYNETSKIYFGNINFPNGAGQLSASNGTDDAEIFVQSNSNATQAVLSVNAGHESEADYASVFASGTGTGMFFGGKTVALDANGLTIPTISNSAKTAKAVDLDYLTAQLNNYALKTYVTNAINSALTWKTLVQNKSCGSSNKISFLTGTWHEIIILAKYHASGASTGGYDYVQATIPYAQWKYANDNYGTGTQVILAGVVENPSDYVNNGHMSMSLRFAKSGTTWQLWVPRVYSHAANVTASALWDAYYR